MKLTDWFRSEIGNLAENTMKNYLSHLRRLPITTVEELNALNDDEIKTMFNKTIRNTPERGRGMCRSALLRVLKLTETDSILLTNILANS